jgi:hypothetical protein
VRGAAGAGPIGPRYDRSVTTRAAIFACGLLTLIPATATAQSTPSGAVTFVYGISAGVGRRNTTGAFTPSDEPADAGQPPSPRTTASLDLNGGLRVAPRLDLMALYEGGATFGNSHGWGTLAAHVVLRGWVATHVWIEGGWGLTELAFRPSAAPGSTTSRWWAPGGEAAAGFDIFQGPTVAINLFARYSEARVDAVRQQSLSFQVGLLAR